MTTWQAIILGIVEGVTEYLPISSTGHLIIAASLLGLDSPERKAAVDAFNIVIQGGAILAVLILYRPQFISILRGVVGRDGKGLRLAINIALAFLPAAITGVLLNDWIESRLFSPGPVIAALALGGLFMIALDQWRLGRWAIPFALDRSRARLPAFHTAGGELDDLTPGRALLIGLLQCIAMWPGTSRSMMTISGGVLVGLKPAAAAQFSFLLGVPTLGGACLYTLYKDFRATGVPPSPEALAADPAAAPYPGMFAVLGVWPVFVGFVVATISAAIAVKWLVRFLNRRGLTPFGVYRLILAVCLLGLIAGEIVRM